VTMMESELTCNSSSMPVLNKKGWASPRTSKFLCLRSSPTTRLSSTPKYKWFPTKSTGRSVGIFDRPCSTSPSSDVEKNTGLRSCRIYLQVHTTITYVEKSTKLRSCHAGNIDCEKCLTNKVNKQRKWKSQTLRNYMMLNTRLW
jgi:hypothetical protein